MVTAMMKWRSKCISVVIARTASRNVAFKAAKIIKMGESVFAGQSVILTREVATTGSSTDEARDLKGLGRIMRICTFLKHQDVIQD